MSELREKAIEEVGKRFGYERKFIEAACKVSGHIAVAVDFAERALLAEQQLAEAREELLRLRDVVSDTDAALIDQFLAPPAVEAREGK
jgi:hypothetical protein